jgi:hypothetical protein
MNLLELEYCQLVGGLKFSKPMLVDDWHTRRSLLIDMVLISAVVSNLWLRRAHLLAGPSNTRGNQQQM